jgi:hypothetical protein
MKPGLWMFLSVVFLIVDVASALPRFSSRTGARCQSCHVNPSGAGMRQPFGVQYGRDKLPVPEWSEELALDDFSTQLTDFVSIGADFRTLFFYRQIPDTGSSSPSNSNAFFQMQGDVYMQFRLARKVSIYIDKGIYSGLEIFGLLNLLPANGFIKVGKFVPNYGTKLDDHTTFIREATGFSPERGRPELTGVEMGIHPGPLSITGGLYNASDGFGAGTGNNKAVLGRAEGLFKLDQNMFLGLGANVFSRRGPAGVRTTLIGGMGSFSYETFTIFGEVDLIKTKTGSATVDGLVTYIEASYMVTPGLDLKLAYDFYDPDKDLKTGAVSRYSIGFEFFPISGVEVRPIYRIVKEDPVDVKSDEFHVIVHFYL